jgi:carboxyl-terminal processing protease
MRSAIRLALAVLLIELAEPLFAAASPPPRREDFSEVWTTVRDHFFDPDLRGVDWEAARRSWGERASRATSTAELSRAINGMLSELETSHTRYYTADDPAYWFLGDLFDWPESEAGYVGIGVFTEEIDGKIFVRSVVDGGPAARAGVRSGDRIMTVDGESFEPIASFVGTEGRAVTVRVERTPGEAGLRDLAVQPERIHPVEFYRKATGASARVLERGSLAAAYVRVWSYAGRENHDLLIDLLNEPALAAAHGLVLDLRDGWGGASPEYLNLFHHGVPRLSGSRRDGKGHVYDPQWRKPAVLLIDETTRSGKEVLAYGFRKYGHGPLVGATTAGAVVGGKGFRIGDRALLYLAISDLRVDGERLEGRGVEPDHPVPFSLPYSAGADPRLERALEVLRSLVERRLASDG